MKKKTLGRLAAAGIAGLTAVSSMGISVSAQLQNNTSNIVSGTVYKVTTTTTSTTPGGIGQTIVTTTYYSSTSKIPAGSSYTEVDVSSAFGSGVTIYVDSFGVVSKTNNGGEKYVTYNAGTIVNPNPNVPSYSSSINWATSLGYSYLGTNGKCYPNLSSLYAAGTSLSQTFTPTNGYNFIKGTSTTGEVYFNQSNGEYQATPGADCVYIYGSTNSYDYHYDHNYNYYGTYDVYKVNGVYYPTLNSALSAAGNNYNLLTKVYDYSKPQTDYFSKVTGRYYPTYSAALAASGNSASNVIDLNYYNYPNDYYDEYYDYNGKYYDPFYYYWLQRQNSKKDDDSSSSSKDTTSAAIGNRKGWTSVAKYLGSLKSGSSVSVDMNYETSVPSSVMSAIKGKNITVKFVLDNGVVFAVNGKNVSSASSIDIDTSYNTKFVPTKLVKAAYKKNDAVSTAQITINDGSFGAKADVTVKFASKRAGCSAKLYRYNSAQNKLVLVDTAKVQSNGKCTFGDVTSGGNFLIVLY